jgi:hypothetical protein
MIDNILVIESANDSGRELDEWLSDWAYHNSPDLASVIQELVNGYYILYGLSYPDTGG